MTTDLEALAVRVEALTGPDREMDVLVAQAIWPQLTHYSPHCAGDEPIFYEDPFHKRRCPHFTRSIDDATTLIKGWRITGVDGWRDGTFGITLWVEGNHPLDGVRGFGHSEALCRVSAALRAVAKDRARALSQSKGPSNG